MVSTKQWISGQEVIASGVLVLPEHAQTAAVVLDDALTFVFELIPQASYYSNALVQNSLASLAGQLRLVQRQSELRIDVPDLASGEPAYWAIKNAGRLRNGGLVDLHFTLQAIQDRIGRTKVRQIAYSFISTTTAVP